MQMETARSNPERYTEYPEQKPITFHPQPRMRPPQSARPAAASSWGEELQSPQRPRTSIGTILDGGSVNGGVTFLTGTDYEERTSSPAAAAHQHAVAPAGGSRMTAPLREEHVQIVRVDHAAAGGVTMSKEEEEEGMKMWKRAERAKFYHTMDHAHVNHNMTDALDRWGERPATSQTALSRMGDYISMDKTSIRRAEEDKRAAELYSMTLAHYTQNGLPYILRNSAGGNSQTSPSY